MHGSLKKAGIEEKYFHTEDVILTQAGCHAGSLTKGDFGSIIVFHCWRCVAPMPPPV